MLNFRLLLVLCFCVAFPSLNGLRISSYDRSLDESIQILESFLDQLENEGEDINNTRFKRDASGDNGVTNMDIRDAILQLLLVIKEGNKKLIQHDKTEGEVSAQVLKKLNTISSTEAVEKKIDNISTFLLRMNGKIDAISRRVNAGGVGGGGGGRGGSDDALATLAQESFDILTLLPTYIENTKDAIAKLSKETKESFGHVEKLLFGDESNDESQSLAKVVKASESNILEASTNLKAIVTESGQMAETLFERVNEGYKELTGEIKGMSKLEKVLMETADSVTETKRKLEFGIQQINYKVESIGLSKGGVMDDSLKNQLANITMTILSNQTEALKSLTERVEKEIGQVWRQMGIMYAQVSSSISILEKVKSYTENYVNKTGSNLGSMSGKVEGLSDRIVDVDENLNYMLGQLKVVVQEFNQVKTGLSQAMTGVTDEVNEFVKSEDQQGQPQTQTGN